jgi:hypothetical protein
MTDVFMRIRFCGLVNVSVCKVRSRAVAKYVRSMWYIDYRMYVVYIGIKDGID